MKLFNRIIAAIATLGAVLACVEEPDVIKVTGIEVNPSTITLQEKDSYTLEVTVSPATATDKTVKWSSSDMSVVAVQDGLIKAIAKGTAVVTATANDGSGASGHCVVTVVESGAAVKGVKLSPGELNMAIGDKTSLTVEIEPADAVNKSVTWSSSDESVAKVSEGEVEAIAEGDATITVKTVDGGFTATSKVHVVKDAVPASKIYFEEEGYTVVKGETLQLQVSCEPADATTPDLKWSTSDSKIATVSSSGLVTGKKYGDALIRAESKSDSELYAECWVSVIPDASSVSAITLSQNEIWMAMGEEYLLYVETDPAGVDIKDMDIELTEADSELNPGKDPVKWSRINSYTIKLDPVVPGDCNIVLTVGSVSESALLHVRKTPKSFELGADFIALDIDETMNFGYKMSPDTPEYHMAIASYTTYTDIADITEDGAVIGLSYGKTMMYAYPAAAPDLEQGCMVYVFDKSGPEVMDINISKKDMFLHLGDEDYVTAIVDPVDATYPIHWSVEDPSIAEIMISEGASECKVRALKLGKTVLHARSVAGNEVDVTCNITVSEESEVESISLPESRTLVRNKSLYLTVSIKGNYDSIEWLNYNPELVRLKKPSGSADEKTIQVEAWNNVGVATVGVVVDNYYTAYCEVHVTPDNNGHEFVDFGFETGNLWAKYNLGDDNNKPYYFAWGGLASGKSFDYESDDYCTGYKGSYPTFSKYVGNYKYWSMTGNVDYLTELEPDDDAAHVLWKGEWSIPSYREFKELLDNTYYTFGYNKSGDYCAKFYKIDENGEVDYDTFIELPCWGYCTDKVNYFGDRGYYWMNCMPHWDSALYPHYFLMDPYSGIFDIESENIERYYGMCIRPVIKLNTYWYEYTK